MITNPAGSVTSAVAVLTVLSPPPAEFVINRFDTAGEIGQWRFDFGGATHSVIFDPSVDGSNNPASGSMKVMLNFNTAQGGNNQAVYTRDAFFPAVNGSNFSALKFDVKVDPASALDAFGKNGWFALVVRNTDNYDWVPQDGRNLSSANGWVHINVPLTAPYNQIRAAVRSKHPRSRDVVVRQRPIRGRASVHYHSAGAAVDADGSVAGRQFPAARDLEFAPGMVNYLVTRARGTRIRPAQFPTDKSNRCCFIHGA